MCRCRVARAALALVAVAVGAGGAPGAPARGQLAALGDILPPFITDNFEQLVQAAADTCEALPLEMLFSRRATPESRQVNVVEVTRCSRRAYRAKQAPAQLLQYEPLPPALLVYIPGWLNTPTDESSETLIKALLQRYPIILILDTRLPFGRGYVSSSSQINALSHVLYEMIEKLHQNGLPLKRLHLLGFSLGSHVAGMTGKLIRERMNGQLERITALDPAKPCFAKSSAYTLRREDAKFVQVIHTSAVLGFEKPLGHVDVYANGVSVKQPECADMAISLECDHAQAWRLFAASAVDEGSFTAHRCHSWPELTRGRCSGNETVVGYGVDPNERGIFLYKSKGFRNRSDKRLRVYSPFDIFTKFFHN